MVGALIIHGAQGGAFSPIAPYGIIVNQLVLRDGLTLDPVLLYVSVLLFHIALAAVVFFALGGGKLIGRRVAESELRAELDHNGRPQRPTPAQLLTLGGLLVLFIGVLFFQLNIGLLSLTIGGLLLLTTPKESRHEPIQHLVWPIVLIISGVLTYIHILEQAGAVAWLGERMGGLGSPLFVVLLLCFLLSAVTGFASTLGTIGILIPLSAPFIIAGDFHVTFLIAALAICGSATDVSPFSTYGALVIANARGLVNRQELMLRLLRYAGVMFLTVPAIAWAIFVLPGW
jgi:di/tricarboxylate transporter